MKKLPLMSCVFVGVVQSHSGVPRCPVTSSVCIAEAATWQCAGRFLGHAGAVSGCGHADSRRCSASGFAGRFLGALVCFFMSCCGLSWLCLLLLRIVLTPCLCAWSVLDETSQRGCHRDFVHPQASPDKRFVLHAFDHGQFHGACSTVMQFLSSRWGG